eukprot:s162_g42.t1
MDPFVRATSSGSRFHVVAHVLGHQDGHLLCRGLSPDQHFEVADAPPLDVGLFTFYDLLKSEDPTVCRFDKDTEALPHHPKGKFETLKVLDLCSGIGGFSIGSQVLGLQTMAFVERNHLACSALHANFDCPIIQGDISDVKVIKQVHRLKLLHQAFLQITGGFPCQGYSPQGDMLGLDDHRSHSLCYILHNAWYLQVDAALLECVANVINFPSTQRCIDHYAENANMRCTKMTFDLQHQWPVRRNRFWCHLISHDHPEIPLPAWPISHDFPTLAHVMPMDAIWGPEDEAILEWDESELAIYTNPEYGSDQRMLTPDDKAPTFLHSWGHVNRPCPCGCRTAFSDCRLRRYGARGFGLRSTRTGKMRHLHPAEGALLCTVPPTFAFPMPLRSALSMLGQIAAPLQVLWLQAHIPAALQQYHWGWTGIDPSSSIQIMQQYLVNHSMLTWVTPRHYQPRHITLQIDDEAQPLEVKISQPLTVQSLAAAEKSLCGWGHYVVVKHNGIRLPPSALLQPGVLYTLELRRCHQAQPFPASTATFGGGTSQSLHDCLGDHIIWQFMQALAQHAAAQHQTAAPHLVYPFRAQHFLEHPFPQGVSASWQQLFQASSRSLYVICEVHQHWILLVGHWDHANHGLSWILHDGLRLHSLRPIAIQITAKLSHLLNVTNLGLAVGHGLLQLSPSTCGTVTLVQMALDLGLLSTAHPAQIPALHLWLLQQQWRGTIFAGGPDSLQLQLSNLISTKGVPSHLAADRSQQIIARLGTKMIQQILSNKNPWSDLKAAASRPGHLFRIVTTEEQANYVAQRAQTKHGASIRNHKAKKSTPQECPEIWSDGD